MVKQENPNFIASKYAPNPKIVLILRNGYH